MIVMLDVLTFHRHDQFITRLWCNNAFTFLVLSCMGLTMASHEQMGFAQQAETIACCYGVDFNYNRSYSELTMLNIA